MSRPILPDAPWGLGSGVAIWALTNTTTASRPDRVVCDVFDQLGSFGRPEHAELTTTSAGEDAWTGAVPPFEPLLRAMLADPGDVEAIHLDLAVEVPGLEEPLHGGATLRLEWIEGRCEITVFVHTNAYAARTWQGSRDNRETAAVMAPRLRGLLTRLQAAFGGRWICVDATGYVDQVDEGGFLLPEDRPLHEDEVRQRIAELDFTGDRVVDFDFSGLDLDGIHAQGTRFVRCAFRRANLSSGDFNRTVAVDCDFGEAVVIEAVFWMADLRGASFEGANLARSQFFRCDLRGASFANADLSGVSISECQTEGMNLDGARRTSLTIR